MGRKAILFGFWLLGYMIGFFAYLFREPFARVLLLLLPSLGVEVVGAIVSGVAGSIIMVTAIIIWSYMST